MGQAIVGGKSYSFALRIIKLYKYLYHEKKEYVLSKQILRSGTAIGALCREAEHAQSRADFLNKMNISLKEAFEQIELQTDYSIAYEQSNLNLKKMQSLSLKSTSIEKALTQILKGTGYTYKIKGYHIIISLPAQKTETIDEKTQKLTQTIRGIVVDSKTNVR